jgi:D-alanine-D-alanine ligase
MCAQREASTIKTGTTQLDRARSIQPEVAVIYSVVGQWDRGEAYEHLADDETVETAEALTAALREVGIGATAVPIRMLEDVRAGLAAFDPADTVVFNVCEALGGMAGGENAVPPLLEELGFRYVGGDGDNLARCQDKALVKRLLAQAGLPTAPAQVMETGNEALTISFPVLVKPLREDSSVGITPDSLVWSRDDLRRQVEHVVAVYHQPALVERFLRGREFYASMWEETGGVRLLAIGAADYSGAPDPSLAFDHFDAKWNNTYPAIYPAIVEPALAARIEQVATAAYRALGCRHYGRVDLREDGDGLFVLEVNPNPALHPTAGFARAARVAGYSYAEMAAYFVRCAWKGA